MHWRDPSELEWIRQGLVHLHETVCRLGVRSVAIPPLGCGLGGLEWPAVRLLVEQELCGLKDMDVMLYVPGGFK